MSLSGLDKTHKEWQETEGIITKLEGMSMLKRHDNDRMTISNFRKRQGTTLTAYERVKKYRETKRDDNEMKRKITMITNDNGIEEKRREEKSVLHSGSQARRRLPSNMF